MMTMEAFAVSLSFVYAAVNHHRPRPDGWRMGWRRMFRKCLLVGYLFIKACIYIYDFLVSILFPRAPPSGRRRASGSGGGGRFKSG